MRRHWRAVAEVALDAQRRRVLMAAGGALLLGACTLAPDRDHSGADAPRALPGP